MKKEKNIVLMATGVALLGYGGYKSYKYKTTETNMPEKDRTMAGASIILGLFVAYIGFVGFNKSN